MWEIQSKYEATDFYESLEKELFSLIQNEKNLVANLANISSWIYHSLPDLNWCGFYLWNNEDQELVLGPFQGRPACIRIKADKGICGSSYSRSQTIRVGDVNKIPEHIACDSASKSELVIPLIKLNTTVGVLDLDSPSINRFSLKDEIELTRMINNISMNIF